MADKIPTRRKRASDSQRPFSGAIDAAPQKSSATYDAEGRITGSGIRVVKQQHDPNWAKTRERAANARTLLAGEAGMVLPENFKLANADAFAADLPTTYTRPTELLAMLLQKRCDIKRHQTTGSQRSKDTATTLEQILAAVMNDEENGYPWFATCDNVQNDSLACVITQPMATFWEQAPDWEDPEKAGAFRPEYQRDKDGRPRKEVDKNFRANGKQSKKAYEEELNDWLANHPPIMYRAFGPQQFTPIFGPNMRVDAVIVAGQYQRTSEMAMQFLWGEDDHLSPQGAEHADQGGGYGAYGEVEILEYWGKDAKNRPYVAYSVDGMATQFRDSNDPAVVDLSPYTSRLPVSVKWGQHWPGASSLDQRGLPFMQPFRQSIRQANAVTTAMAVSLFWAGFPAYTMTPDPNLPGAVYNAGAPRTIDIEPLKIIETSGSVTPLQAGQFSPEVMGYLQFLMGENERAAPSGSAAGRGEGSGFEKTIARAYAEDAQFLILEGIRQLYEESASFTLEILTNIAREKNRPVVVYYAGPVLSLAESDDVSSTRVMLELTPDMAGRQWKVKAQYPPSMSLAERQQSAELVERRLKTRRKHFEDDGDPSPERTVAEIEAEELVNSPMGQMGRWDMIAKILGDDKMAERIKLMQQQKISAGPDGKGGLPFSIATGFEDILAERAAAEQGGAQGPVPGMQPAGPVDPAMLAQMPLGAPEGGSMTGMGSGSIATSSLAGQIGGAMSAGPIANAEAAGGMVPPDLNQGLG